MTLRPYTSAISWMRLVLQGVPYTCTGMMAVVCGVIAASIFSGSILPVFSSTSTKTGLRPFHQMECVVATKLYGVVITSPVIRMACSAVMSGNVPFVNRLMYLTPRYSAKAFSSSLW